MSRKVATKEEKHHLNLVASMGCIICEMPAEIHHIRARIGLGMRSSHYSTIPLCHSHHRTGGHGIAFHAGPKTWQTKFGTEEELLTKVRKRLP